MARRITKSNRPLLSVARRNIEISATVAAMAVGAVIVPPTSGVRHVAARSASANAANYSRLLSIPSHNDMYSASLVPLGNTRGETDTWVVDVRTAAGGPVENATLALESWMPEDEDAPATPARVTGYLGDGRYRVEALRLGTSGWSNVRLDIASAAGRDSLAFKIGR